MSSWQVNLEFEDGKSSKFWRARIEGTTLFVNYGRIGTNGQTQIKQLDSPEVAQKELEKLEREKRKKGYADSESAAANEDDGEEDEEPTPITSVAPTRPSDLALDQDGRKVDLRLVQDGASLRLIAVERYASAEEAARALTRLKAAFEAEGYRGAAHRSDP